MTTPLEDPVCLAQDPEADDELRALLEAARDEDVDDERVERLAARLGPLLAPQGGAGGSSGSSGPSGSSAPSAPSAPSSAASTTSTTSGALALPLGVKLLGGALLAFGVAWGAARSLEPFGEAPPPSEADRAAEEPLEGPPTAPARSVDAPALEALEAPPPAATEAHREPPEEAPPIEPSLLPAPGGGGPRSPRRAPADDEASSPPEASPGEGEAAVSEAPSDSPALHPAEGELELVRDAHRLLASSPSAALARVAEHERAFPSGAFVDEREVIAIDALVRLGRRDEAEARAARFRASRPGSASLRRIERLLAE